MPSSRELPRLVPMVVAMVAATVCVQLAWSGWMAERHPEIWARFPTFAVLQLLGSLGIARLATGHRFGRLEAVATLCVLGAVLAFGHVIALSAFDPLAEVARGRSIWTGGRGCLSTPVAMGARSWAATGVFVLAAGAAAALSSPREMRRAIAYAFGLAALMVIAQLAGTSGYLPDNLGWAGVAFAISVFGRTAGWQTEDSVRAWGARLLAVVAAGASFAAQSLAEVSTIRGGGMMGGSHATEPALRLMREASASWPWLALVTCVLLVGGLLPGISRLRDRRELTTAWALLAACATVLLALAGHVYAEERLFVDVLTRVYQEPWLPDHTPSDMQLAALRKGRGPWLTDFEVHAVREHAARSVTVSAEGAHADLGSGGEVEFDAEPRATVEDFVDAVVKHANDGERLVVYAGQ